ncbi:MAG: hypothetical protein WC187_06440 [Bacillota bacterium]
MVRIGRYILFERGGEDHPTKEEQCPPPSLMLMNQQLGALQNELKHREEREKEQERRISELERKIEELMHPRIRKDNYAPPDELMERIVRVLEGRAMTSTEIREAVAANANRTSRALKELHGAGKVGTRTEGKKKLFYLKSRGKTG